LGYSALLAQPVPEKAEGLNRVKIERVGGFAGFGLPGSRLKSVGEVAISDLSTADRNALDALFESKEQSAPSMPDAFRYRITRQTSKGLQTIEVPEERVPAVLRNSVKDQLE